MKTLKVILIILSIVLTSCYKEVVFDTDTTVPTAIFSISNVDSTYTFDATESNDVDGDIIYLQWNIDGNWTEYLIGYDDMFFPVNRVMTHTFISGTHIIKLRVKDDNGWNDMVEETIVN